jgi:HEAT repeat protein
VKKPWRVRLLVGGICALAGAVLLLWSLRPSPEDPGSVKVLAIKAAADDPIAIAALRDLGSNAVPSLARLLDYQDPFFRVRAWALAPILPKQWARALTAKLKPLEASGVRVAAGKSLALLGPQAAEAVPDLLRTLRDPEPFIAMQNAFALGRIGKPSVSGLSNALSDKKPAIRHAAAFGLGEAGSAAKPAVPQLIQSLEDRDAQVRSTSAYSLSLICGQVIVSLSNIIEHADSAQRQSAARELAQFCQTLRSMTPLASKMQHRDDEDSRRVALGIFGSIRTCENGAARTLGRALEEPDAGVRLAAVQGLGLLNWRTEAAVAYLRKGLQDSSAAVREWAARDLGAMGPAAGSALEDLKLAAGDNEPGVRAAAREAVETIKRKAAVTN